jgi:hypothetical protein
MESMEVAELLRMPTPTLPGFSLPGSIEMFVGPLEEFIYPATRQKRLSAEMTQDCPSSVGVQIVNNDQGADTSSETEDAIPLPPKKR